MRDPVRGEFRPTGSYFPHPGRVPMREMLTGVVTGPGVGPAPAEALNDLKRGRAIGRDVLPVLVDRADPSTMLVLWDELPPFDGRAEARRAAEQAARTMRDPAAAADGPQPDAGAATPDWAQALVADLAGRGLLPGLAASDGHVTGVTASVEFDSGSSGWRSGTAVLRGVAEVPLPPESLPEPTASMCVLTLDVRPLDGPPYAVRVRQGFRNAQRRAAIAVIGATLPVLIDPLDPRHVVLDVRAIDRQRPDG